MPNPEGTNPLHPAPGYGDIKKAQTLQKSAPMSGAPIATPAVNAPQRAQAQAKTRTTGQVKGVGTPPEYQAELAATWAEIASVPGASALVQQLARRAAQYGA